jgi:hypothetical protein
MKKSSQKSIVATDWGNERVSATIALSRCMQRRELTGFLVLRICENQLITPCIYSLQARQVP